MASSLLLLAAALPALSLAQSVNARSSGIVHAGNLIHYPLVATTGSSVFGSSKRQNSVSALGQRTGTIYTINISLGTPGQSVPVQFDTGASEVWVNPVCAQASDQAFCLAQPRFTQSTTLVDLGVQGYNDIVRGPGGDGTGYVNFEYVADYVAIGSARITQQIFGVAYDSVRPSVGILGVGPEQSASGWDSAYPHILDSLATQGFINSRAFSMDLQGLGSTSGSVIFGGIDTKKYQGSLIKLPIVPAAQSPDGNTRYYVRLDGISVNQPDGTVVSVYQKAAGGLGQVVQIHSGYTLSSFSTIVFQKLVAAFPSAQAVEGDELYSVDCLDAGQGGSLDFTFGDKVINVPYSDFVWRDPRSGLCILGAFADDYISVLGDTFLRAAYVVFDWDNRNIHLAQSADCGSNLVAIGAGADAVPSVVGDCAVIEPTSTSSLTTASSTSTTETSTTTSEVSTTSEASTTSEESTTSLESSTSSTTEESTTASSTPDTTSSSTTESSTETSTTETSTTETSTAETSTAETSTTDSSFSSSSDSSSTLTITSAASSATATSTEEDPDWCDEETETDTATSTSSSTLSSVDPTITGSSTSSSSSSQITPTAIITSSSTTLYTNTSSTATSTSTEDDLCDEETETATATSSSSAGSAVDPALTFTSTSSSTAASSTGSAIDPAVTVSSTSITSSAGGTSSVAPILTGSDTSSTTAPITPGSSITALPAPIEQSTLTYTHTTIYTITSCGPEKTACHPGQVVTEVVTSLTTVCPQTTATYTIGKVPVTITPAVTGGTLIPVPGCTPGAPGPTGDVGGTSSGKPAIALSAAAAGPTAAVTGSSGKPAAALSAAAASALAAASSEKATGSGGAVAAVSGEATAAATQVATATSIPAPSSYWSTALSGGNGTVVPTSKPTSPPVVVAGAGKTIVMSAVAGLVVVAGVMAFGL